VAWDIAKILSMASIVLLPLKDIMLAVRETQAENAWSLSYSGIARLNEHTSKLAMAELHYE
jgi:hypothetical protein